MLNKLLESKAYTYLKGFKELIGVLLFVAPLVLSPLNPDLVTVVRQEHLAIPISAVPQSLQKSTAAQSGLTLLTIELINHSSDPVHGVEVVVNGIDEVAVSAATSTSARLAKESLNLGKIEPKSDQSFYFPYVENIPPRQAIMIQIVGRLNEQLMFFPRVEVKSSAKSSRVVRTVQVSGFFGFIYENRNLLVAVALVFLAGIGLWRISNEAKTS